VAGLRRATGDHDGRGVLVTQPDPSRREALEALFAQGTLDANELAVELRAVDGRALEDARSRRRALIERAMRRWRERSR
jgi:hypothetical protein